MKGEGQKHKTVPATAGVAKKLKTKAGSGSEKNDIATTTELPKEKANLEHPSLPGKMAKQKPDDWLVRDPLR
jgi:hypothetical protein